MVEKRHLIALSLVTASVWAADLWFRGVELDYSDFYHIPAIASAIGAVIWLFDRYLWRLRLLSGWFVGVPDLGGTWSGRLRSSFIPKGKSEPWVDENVYIVVRQRFSGVSVQLLTQESTSKTVSCSVSADERGIVSLQGVFRNVPKALLRAKSPIHMGGFLLDLSTGDERYLEGEYGTSRGTHGELHFDRRSKRIVNTFEAAVQLDFAVVC